MQDPGQVVLAQSAVQLDVDGVLEVRFAVGLPACGRRIDGPGAVDLLTERVPALVSSTLLNGAHDPDEVERCAATNEDADHLRSALAARGLVAFIADGSSLPRRSGIGDQPLDPEEAIAFLSPGSMRVRIETPNRGPVTGMGIPEGLTLIVGGGFHGKSTLLRAIQSGVWNHEPDDGRSLVVTRDDAVKVRAEDGRSVSGVDISPFITDLPGGEATTAFSSSNASGSTSQAAAIVEALECGSRLLLVDEDTSATNFMIRDHRMQELIPSSGEPITPFLDRVEELRDDHGVSTVLVLGGSGDYLDAADLVLRMDGYRPYDITIQAHATAKAVPTGRTAGARGPLTLSDSREIDWSRVQPGRGRRAVNVKSPDDRTLIFGRDTIDLAALEQLVGRAQIRAIGLALAWTSRSHPAARMPDALDMIMKALGDGLDTFDDSKTGELAAFRRYEIAAVLNRLRALRVG